MLSCRCLGISSTNGPDSRRDARRVKLRELILNRLSDPAANWTEPLKLEKSMNR
jgi:hypothetical protein